MGFSLKKIGRKLGKSLKKVSKIAVPLIASSVTGGLPVAAFAGKAIAGKAISRLKSMGIGRNAMRIAGTLPHVAPVSVRASIEKFKIPAAERVYAGPRPRRAPTSPAAPRSRRKPSATPTPARLRALFKQWDAEGRPGDWQTYAAERL